MKKNSFVLYSEYIKYFDKLSMVEKGKLIDALLKYCQVLPIEEELKQMKDATEMAFLFISSQTDRDTTKYDRRCETSKQNGTKGGNPNFQKGQPNPYYVGECDNLNNNLNDNLKDNHISEDKPNDNDNDNENDNDSKEKNNKKEKSAKKPSTVLKDSDIASLIEKSFQSEVVRNQFYEFIEMRKAKGQSKAVRTQATFDGLVNSLRKYAKNEKEAVAILQKSIDDCWQGLFPLKQPVEDGEVVPYAN